MSGDADYVDSPEREGVRIKPRYKGRFQGRRRPGRPRSLSSLPQDHGHRGGGGAAHAPGCVAQGSTATKLIYS